MFRLTRKCTLFSQRIFVFPFLVTLVWACLPNIGAANDLDQNPKVLTTKQLMPITKIEPPVEVEAPFSIRATYLRAWAVVYEDFLQVYNLDENSARISEYGVSFYEKDDEIVIEVGKIKPQLGGTVTYQIRKTDYKLISKTIGL